MSDSLTVINRKAVLEAIKPHVRATTLKEFKDADSRALVSLITDIDDDDSTTILDDLIESGAIDKTFDSKLEDMTGLTWYVDQDRAYNAYHNDVAFSVWYVYPYKVWRASWTVGYETRHPETSETIEREGFEDVVEALFKDYGTAPTDEVLELLGGAVTAPVKSRLRAYTQIAEHLEQDPNDPEAVLAAVLKRLR